MKFKSKFWVKRTGIGMLALFLSVGLWGCSSANNQETPKNTQTETNKTVVEPAKGASDQNKQTVYPLTMKDASGKEITFNKAPERIVSLAPSLTEVLFALGLGDKVVGVTEYCDFPVEAKSKPKIGDLNANAEAVLAANSDLIVGGYTMNGKAIENIRNLKLTVFAVEPKSLDGVLEQIKTIGQITNRQVQAEELIAKMTEEKKAVTDAVKGITEDKKKKVLIEFYPGWTVGTGEFMSELIELAGAKNAASNLQGWKEFNVEQMIQSNPDVILYGVTTPDLDKTIKARGGWSQINAVKNNQVISLDDTVISRPGPRITQALKDMAHKIYPELVK